MCVTWFFLQNESHSHQQTNSADQLSIVTLTATAAVLCCAVLCCSMLFCAVLCVLHVLNCAVLYCTALCRVVLLCVVPCCAVLCCVVLCCAVLCCSMLSCPVLFCAEVWCCSVLCGTVLCYAVWCSVVQCGAVLFCFVLCCVALCGAAQLFCNSVQRRVREVFKPAPSDKPAKSVTRSHILSKAHRSQWQVWEWSKPDKNQDFAGFKPLKYPLCSHLHQTDGEGVLECECVYLWVRECECVCPRVCKCECVCLWVWACESMSVWICVCLCVSCRQFTLSDPMNERSWRKIHPDEAISTKRKTCGNFCATSGSVSYSHAKKVFKVRGRKRDVTAVFIHFLSMTWIECVFLSCRDYWKSSKIVSISNKFSRVLQQQITRICW
jgi:hypothetical protein